MNQLKRNIVANFLGRAWTNILAILFIPVYLRFIGVEGYGIIGFFTLLQSVIGFMDLGIGAALNREMARLSFTEGSAEEQRDLLRTLEVIYWFLAIFAGTLVFIMAPFLAHDWIKTENMPADSVLSAIRLMGFAIILQFPMALYQAGLMGLQKQVLVNGVLVAVGTLRTFGSVLVLWLLSSTVQAFLGWQLLVNALSSGIFLYYLWRNLPVSSGRPHFKTSLMKGIWKYAAAMGGNAFLGVALTQLDKIILSKMLSLEVFGYYVLAGTVAAGIWSIIGPFNAALFPRFVQLYEIRNFDGLSRLLHSSSQVLSVILLPITVILIFFAHDILLIWTRNSVVAENAHMLTSLLVLGAAINGLASVPATASTAFGWPQLITFTNLAQALVLVPATVIMTKYYGALGAATVWVFLNCTYLLIMTPIFFRRCLGAEKWLWYVRDTGTPLLCTLMVCLSSYYLMPQSITSTATLLWLSATWLIASIHASFFCSNIRNNILRYIRNGLVLR